MEELDSEPRRELVEALEPGRELEEALDNGFGAIEG